MEKEEVKVRNIIETSGCMRTDDMAVLDGFCFCMETTLFGIEAPDVGDFSLENVKYLWL